MGPFPSTPDARLRFGCVDRQASVSVAAACLRFCPLRVNGKQVLSPAVRLQFGPLHVDGQASVFCKGFMR